MHILFLDLASHDALIACCTDESVVAFESVHARISDAELIPMVESVLQKAGWTYEDLTHIACIVGPGGFTSLRVAVTYVNVLADQLGIPSAGVHLSDLYRERAKSLKLKAEIYWLHSTKKDQLFICGGKWQEPTLITLDELRMTNDELQRWCGELIEEHHDIVHCDSIPLKPVTDVLPALLAAQTFEKKLLTPWYGRGW
ncbi:MAG: tRNA (adenosine(37)-N6)-threonylcarbamoyltransferase complex dimerization subunit type 1 TsaB [Candidatus Peregrinibacteria bacterium]|nr:tRNA (adenosine(37)-N6)-threonylcarbamoyltransferase complex dimerization subunit type 1 TsaB [Candidatus Peregrinibacteria bacterium]MCB9807947.1 tRNA (adenosine(37)-N6)-threonylcarbamoyltransferase complex dimerization subunit type 1 TsaB [Candidatus Peribacteria bacterium]